MKIFIIEDEKILREELTLLLKKYGYTCVSGDDFANIADIALAAEPDLILLDINLPYQDGFYVCQRIRKSSAVPIIVLTSRHTYMDELMSLNIGADDFIAKPYNAQVLLARIHKVLERADNGPANVELVHGGLKLNLLKATAGFEDKTIELTKNELGILRLLIANKGDILSRDVIINELWQDEAFIDENTLNVNIVRLRKKLTEIGLSGYLKTKRGMGYYV